MQVLSTAEDLAGMFRLLGDATRVRLLMALVEEGELCVGDLADRGGVSDTNASQALRLLRGARIVRARREGRHVFYRLDDDHVAALLDLSSAHVSHGTIDE